VGTDGEADAPKDAEVSLEADVKYYCTVLIRKKK
jgi:hypothetical protein